jgi:hypothetical protein
MHRFRLNKILALVPMVALALLASLAFLSPARAEAQVVAKTNIYRLYNPNTGEHFYTASLGEAKSVTTAGWQWEGIGFTDSTSSEDGSPVYRVYNPNPGGRHHLTKSAAEKNWLVSLGWKDEGVAWYEAGDGNLYRVYNPNSGEHHYTRSAGEANHLKSIGWRLESTNAWKVGVEGDYVPVPGAPFRLETSSWGYPAIYEVQTDGSLKEVERKLSDVEKDAVAIAEKYGSGTDYFLINDVWGLKLTVLKRQNGSWSVFKNIRINWNGGKKTNTGVKKIVAKAPLDNNGSLWKDGADVNPWFTATDRYYEQSPTYVFGGISHGRYEAGKGYWNAQGFHEGYSDWANKPASSRHGGTGCTCLDNDDAKWIYDNIPVNTTVYAF